METVKDFIFLVSKITMNGACSHDIKKIYAPQKKSYDIVRHCIKKKKKKKNQGHHFANKGEYSQSYGFSSSHIVDICPVDIFQ